MFPITIFPLHTLQNVLDLTFQFPTGKLEGKDIVADQEVDEGTPCNKI